MSHKRVGQVRYPRDEPQGPDDFAGQHGLTKLEVSVVIAVGLLFCLSVTYQSGSLDHFMRSTHFEWTWRDLGIFKTVALLFAPFAVIVWILRKNEEEISPAFPYLSLALLALSNFLLQLLGILADPRGIQLVREIVASPIATSYFTDAMGIQQPLAWLSHFHNAKLGLHSATHPPGPILFYFFFIKLFGPSAGALIGGCVVGLLASAGVLVIYNFAALWTLDCRARLTASALYTLLPALTVLFPEFDQVYPILSMLLMLFWVRAVNASSEATKYAFYTGAVLFVTTFFAYNLLLVGAFLAYYGLYWLWRQKWTWSAGAILLRTSGIALGVYAGLNTALWLASGYYPIASFRHAMSNQAIFASDIQRPYALFAMLDPYDFFVGAGILALPILLFHVQHLLQGFDAKRTDIVLTLIGLGTIVTVDLSGLLRGEAVRVWLFLQPLLVVPVAREISRLSWSSKLSIFALQWWIVACLKAKFSFVNP